MNKQLHVIVTLCLLLIATAYTATAQHSGQKFKDYFRKSDNITKPAANQPLNKKTNHQPEAIIEMDWHGNDFDTTGRTDYFYNSHGDDVLHISNRYVAGNFIPYMHDTFMYNSNRQITERIVKAFNGAIWVNQMRQVNTYNSENDLEEELYQGWNSTGSNWENSYGLRYNYTYNANGDPTVIINEYLMPPSTSYQYSYKEEYSYNANNEPSEVKFYAYDDTAGTWNLEFRFTNITWHMWDGNLHDPLATHAELEIWTGSSWMKGQRTTATFNSNDQRLSEAWENWTGSGYMFDWRETYSYDAQGNLLTYFDEEYDMMASAWDTLHGDKHVYTYHTDNRIDTEVLQEYDAGDWLNMHKRLYVYSSVGIAKRSHSAALKVYPNPTADVLNLNTNLNRFTATISDITGKTVLVVQNQVSIDVKDLKPGFYMLHIAGENGAATIKFLKQ